MATKRLNWNIKTEVMHIHTAQSGGLGITMALAMLKCEGIQCRRVDSPYVGMVGVEVPYRNRTRAEKTLFG